MRHFFKAPAKAIAQELLAEGQAFKKAPFSKPTAGQHKTLGLLFFNSSLRTRMSMQKAAQNLGLNCIILNINSDSWKLEWEDGAIMSADKPEHIREAAAVMGTYCDLIGIRAFANLQNAAEDYAEKILNKFIEFAKVPIINMESATVHPLQSLADWMTIEEHRPTYRPKVVLTWAPHPKALPQAVANSFLNWAPLMDINLTITHPKGYELAPEFSQNFPIEYNQEKAFEGADFIYAKNWSSFSNYGQVLDNSLDWTITGEKMQRTNNAKFMHCLPLRRNYVATDEVMDAPYNLCLNQAENRVYSAQTVLYKLLQEVKQPSEALELSLT